MSRPHVFKKPKVFHHEQTNRTPADSGRARNRTLRHDRLGGLSDAKKFLRLKVMIPFTP